MTVRPTIQYKYMTSPKNRSPIRTQQQPAQ
jgi:hypothetical protein